MELIVLGILVSVWLTYSTAKSYQLHKFNIYIGHTLCRADINIYESCMNLMKSPAWDYNFEEMIVYDV